MLTRGGVKNAMEALTFLRESGLSELSRRQEQVLLGLIEGQSEKEIARSLEISWHTVHIYVKAVYRHYQVHSRAELLSHWINQLLRASNGIQSETQVKLSRVS
jgi:DNA-binding NarL/FixJ family response regulator